MLSYFNFAQSLKIFTLNIHPSQNFNPLLPNMSYPKKSEFFFFLYKKRWFQV